MGAEPRLHVVDPVAGVLLVGSDPVHRALAVTLVLFPVALVEVSRRIGHFSLAPLHAFLPVALVDGAILVAQFAVTVAHSVDPLSFVFDTLIIVDVQPLAMSEAVNNVTLVGGAILPLVGALSSDFVLTELSFVDGSVCPFKGSFSMQQSITELALVLMAIFEHASALAVEDFADLQCHSGRGLPIRSFGSQ